MFINLSKNKILILSAFIVLAIFIIWLIFGKTPVEGYKVIVKEAIKGVTVSGTVVSADDIDLSTKFTGKLKAYTVKEGEYVRQGQLLANLYPDEAVGNLIATKGQVESALANLRNLQTEPRFQQVEIAKYQVNELSNDIKSLQDDLNTANFALQDIQSEEKRLETLYKQGAVSFRDYEKASLSREQSEERVKSAEEKINAAFSRLNQSKANLSLIQEGVKKEQISVAKGQVLTAKGYLDSAESTLSDYQVFAPVSGFVIDEILDPGEIVSPNNVLLRLVSPNKIYISAQVEENELSNINVGQNAYIIFDAYPNAIYNGKVREITKEVNPVSGTFEAKVYLLPHKNLKMVVGMTTDVTIIVKNLPSSIIIPNQFVSTQNKKKFVLKKVGNKAIKTIIEGYEFDNNRFLVVKGLSKGDIILKSPNHRKLKANKRVNLVSYYEG